MRQLPSLSKGGGGGEGRGCRRGEGERGMVGWGQALRPSPKCERMDAKHSLHLTCIKQKLLVSEGSFCFSDISAQQISASSENKIVLMTIFLSDSLALCALCPYALGSVSF